ncbi:DedA family protein [Mycobacterium sp. P7213]|uniref:DedA family protein n=1 Tax=Mycobacterium sp. P7213 TaxID=2478465 RepID=UPI000F637DB5|nr:VTT domain-containing protein [Mycobacterium sp. P7213]
MPPFPQLPELPHGPVLYLLLAAIVVASSIPVLSIVVAAEPILMTLIVLSPNGRLSIMTLMIITVVAAVLGDALSYALGRRFGPRLLRTRLAARAKRITRKAAETRQRSMMGALLVQRWVPPTRGFVPARLGAAHKPFGVVVALSALASMVWAAVIIAGSYAGGAALLVVMPVLGLLVPVAAIARRVVTARRARSARAAAV